MRAALEPGAAPGPVLRLLTRGALDEARDSLAPRPPETHVRVGLRSRHPRRTR